MTDAIASSTSSRSRPRGERLQQYRIRLDGAQLGHGRASDRAVGRSRRTARRGSDRDRSCASLPRAPRYDRGWVGLHPARTAAGTRRIGSLSRSVSSARRSSSTGRLRLAAPYDEACLRRHAADASSPSDVDSAVGAPTGLPRRPSIPARSAAPGSRATRAPRSARRSSPGQRVSTSGRPWRTGRGDERLRRDDRPASRTSAGVTAKPATKPSRSTSPTRRSSDTFRCRPARARPGERRAALGAVSLDRRSLRPETIETVG